MGIAEIQAAFAASQPAPAQTNPFGAPPAPAPFAQQLAPAQPTAAFPAPAPSPNPFAAATQAGFAAAAPAPAAPFQFTPPAGFNPASAPPINPVGERQSLNTEAPVVEAQPAVVAPEPESPKRRTRKPKAEPAPVGVLGGPNTLDEGRPVGLTGHVSIDTQDPADGLTTEQLVQFLVDRGYAVRLERA